MSIDFDGSLDAIKKMTELENKTRGKFLSMMVELELMVERVVMLHFDIDRIEIRNTFFADRMDLNRKVELLAEILKDRYYADLTMKPDFAEKLRLLKNFRNLLAHGMSWYDNDGFKDRFRLAKFTRGKGEFHTFTHAEILEKEKDINEILNILQRIINKLMSDPKAPFK